MKMEVSMAMAILEFPPAQSFEHTELIEVEKKFMIKIHQIAVEKVGEQYESTKTGFQSRRTKHKDTIFFKQKSDARRLNEAFQFLVQRRRRLSGRSMNTNWQLLASKTASASNITDAFQVASITEMPSKGDSSLPKESITPAGSNSFNLLSLIGGSAKTKEPAPNTIETERIYREQQSQMARELANELISTRKIKSLRQVLDESNGSGMEMNYWLQFDFMSKENKEYFIMRHGKNPDNFLDRLKRVKKENNRISINLPLRLKNLQNISEEKLKANKESKDRNRDPRIPQRTPTGSFKSHATKKESNRKEINYLADEYSDVSNVENNQYERLEVSLNSKIKEKESMSSEEYEVYIEDENTKTTSNDCKADEKNAILDDNITQQNSPNLKNKLSVLRRRLSHLNMNPNIPQ